MGDNISEFFYTKQEYVKIYSTVKSHEKHIYDKWTRPRKETMGHNISEFFLYKAGNTWKYSYYVKNTCMPNKPDPEEKWWEPTFQNFSYTNVGSKWKYSYVTLKNTCRPNKPEPGNIWREPSIQLVFLHKTGDKC